MARAGASKSLDKPGPKARGASGASTPAPAKATAKAAAKATRKKTEPVAAAPKPPAKAAKAAKPAAKVAKPVKKAAKPAAKPAKAASKQVKAPKTAKPVAKAGRAVKPAPAKAVNVKTKAAPATRSTPQKRHAEVPQVAEAPKGKRGGAATKTPPRTAPAATADKPEASAGFPAKTLDRLRRLLEEDRETYVRQARDLAAEAEALATEREPGDTQFDEESGEGDTLNVERERDLALSASATQAVEEIDRALRRMDLGTYGICERCGKKISVARLEALPFAALCIDCKSREERRR